MSGVTKTDWTRNLSLHFASVAGSSFIACKRTVLKPISSSSYISAHRRGKRTLDIDGPAGLDTAGVRTHTIAERKSVIKGRDEIARSRSERDVLLGGSCFDLKRGKETESDRVFMPDKYRGEIQTYLKDDRVLAVVAQTQNLAYFLREGACSSSKISFWGPLGWPRSRHLRLKPSSLGMISTDMVIVNAQKDEGEEQLCDAVAESPTTQVRLRRRAMREGYRVKGVPRLGQDRVRKREGKRDSPPANLMPEAYKLGQKTVYWRCITADIYNGKLGSMDLI